MANNILPGEHDWMDQMGGMNPGMGFPSPPPARGPSIMDRIGGMLGGGVGMEGMDEQTRKLIQRQALLAMGAQLMQGGGWSPNKTTFGQAMGPAIMAGMQTQQQGADQSLQALLLRSQIKKNERTKVGGTTPSAVSEYEYAKANGFKGSFEEWKRVASAQPQAPAGIQEYEYFNKLSPEQQKQFLSLQRSPVVPQVVTINGVPTLVDRTNGSTNALSSLSSETDSARQLKEAEAAGKAAGDITGARTAKAPTALATYQTGMESLKKAMDQTNTGPLAGRIPALTANQQVAEGAEATMAPVLKQLFRDSGEGTFTDADQALLMKMVPTRTDHPEARKAKIEMIDGIVRAKLGIQGTQSATSPVDVGQSTTINGVKVRRVK
jgi:hypothetical protein